MKAEPRKESKDRQTLRSVLNMQEWHLKRAQDAWDSLVEKIRTNPNQMNPHGLWMTEQLANFHHLRTAILIYDAVVVELKMALGEKLLR
jgi:hypothetical protein